MTFGPPLSFLENDIAIYFMMDMVAFMQGGIGPDVEFVQKFTPPDFQAKNFTPSISPNFNSFSGKNTKNA